MGSSSNAALTSFPAFFSEREARSASVRPPRGNVWPTSMLLPRISANSSEPPPRSPAMPSGSWILAIIPSAASRASRLPDRTSIGVRQIFSASRMKFGPSFASRTADVAITLTSPTSITSQSARKRLSAPRALVTASAFSLPLVLTSRPRPHSTFSLKIGVGLREIPSYTTRRTEFEPMSTTAMGLPSGRRPGAAFASGSVRSPDETARRRIFERFATTRKTWICHEVAMGVERLLALDRDYAGAAAIGQDPPALLIILQIRDHDLVENLLMHGGI